MRRFFILMILSLFLLTTLSGALEQLTLEEVRRHFLDAVNHFRGGRGLEELELKYSFIAQEHANLQASMDKYLAHKGFDARAKRIMGYIKDEALSQGGSFGFVSVAENCCYFQICSDPAKKAFEKFCASAMHRMNLLKRCQYTAIGIAQGESGRFYVCQILF